MIKVENLTITTRQPILKNFSANFESRKIYQIAAENGMGKTTFLKALCNLIRYQGSIEFNSQPYSKCKQEVFFFEENNWLDTNLNSWDYLNLVKKLWGSDCDLNKEIKFWGIDQFVYLPIKKYSLGMKQKLIIAMYFASDAQYLLMDEITNGLDANSRTTFYTRVNELIKNSDKCIILTSHYANEIKSLDNLTKLKLENLTMHEDD
ncbi:ATP-binding cassette domain-containing protein [uncultured Lactobacillus sp.]|uniref:ATP-binding cassette domain-containing protein n=1 Tax=uncultured Lactobacillus sp. TaxID=153152 RepID=UPI002604BEAE|nr:ATP-binding cassette domain-containing protein [uncultured Lactobacillus sp.]